MRKAAVALGSLAGLYATVCLCTQQALAAVPIASMPLVSAGLPAYTSDDCFTSKPASDANSGNYSVPWRSCNNPPSTGTPVTLTYDISSVPSAQRTNDVLVWFNDFSTGNYNPTLNSNNYYNTPKDYTVQGNTAASSGTPGERLGDVGHRNQQPLSLAAACTKSQHLQLGTPIVHFVKRRQSEW